MILLLGSLSCFSVAMQKTGLAEALADDLVEALQGWPACAVLLVMFVLGQAFTEALSNGTTVVLLLPIATELAKGLAMPPMACISAITFAANDSFLTPIRLSDRPDGVRPRWLPLPGHGPLRGPLTIALALTTPWPICRQFGL